MTINEKLKEMRCVLGYPLRYVALHARVAKSTISNIELGKVDCGYKKIQRLQNYYESELAKRIQGAEHESD